MVSITISVPEEIDKKIQYYKVDNKKASKADAIQSILREYFERQLYDTVREN